MTRIGIVGAGGIGRKHLEALADIPGAQIAAVVDADGDAALSASPPGCPHFTDMSACLPLVDAVWICTPPSSHRELAEAALRAGKHVYCEKPLASSMEDALAIVGAAEASDAVFATGFNMRYRRGFRRLRELLAEGAAGKPFSYWCHRVGSLGDGSYNWRTDPKLLCGMTIESLSHDIDTIRWLFGEIVDVRAVLQESRADLPGYDDNVCALLTTGSGVTATIHASWSSALGRGSRGVVGSDGAIALEGPDVWTVSGVRWRTKGMDHERAESFSDTLGPESYRAADADFLSSLADGRPRAPTALDGLAALSVSSAMLESSRTGNSVRLRP